MLSICLYAELLGNIRQVNIFATLPSQQNHSTKVELSLSHEILILTHDGHYASIQLPCKVATPKAWTMPVPESQDLYFRLQVMNDAVPARSGHSTDITAPWAAKSLTCDTEIACRVCKTLLLAKSGMTWKDLPSEEWAEMMDFWHCHRPSNTGLDSTNATKGTLIAEKLKARPGIGLLDTCHLILAEYDCLNLKDGENMEILCMHCQTMIAKRDTSSGGIQFDKWNISLRRANCAHWEQYPAQMFLTASLLERIERQAVRKFLVCDSTSRGADEALVFWVFNPDLRYSTSAIADGPRHAIKVLYKFTERRTEFIAQHHMTVEELELPLAIIGEIRRGLEVSTNILPISARKLQEWHVGLLDRFDNSCCVARA